MKNSQLKPKRKICFFTGSRADYGLMNPLISQLKKDPSIKTQLLVSGMHLSPEFGLTMKEITANGKKIDRAVKMLSAANTELGICHSIGNGVTRISDALQSLKPDILVILGDRFESLAAAIAAYVLHISVAHIHGGEITQGAMDDVFRHAITKFSYLHFTSHPEYQQRVMQLGESPERIFMVGAVGVENSKKTKFLSKDELAQQLGITFRKHNLLVTFHPMTMEGQASQVYMKNILSVLGQLKDTAIIFTKANADAYGKVLNKMIDQFVSAKSHNAYCFASLGQTLYLSLMPFMDAVLGNSSSGILEAPSFKIGTINIGDRQEGRIRAASVIDCQPTTAGIQKAFKQLYSPAFQSQLKRVTNPYYRPNTTQNIVRVLKNFKLNQTLKKYFFDIPYVK